MTVKLCIRKTQCYRYRYETKYFLYFQWLHLSDFVAVQNKRWKRQNGRVPSTTEESYQWSLWWRYVTTCWLVPQVTVVNARKFTFPFSQKPVRRPSMAINSKYSKPYETQRWLILSSCYNDGVNLYPCWAKQLKIVQQRVMRDWYIVQQWHSYGYLVPYFYTVSGKKSLEYFRHNWPIFEILSLLQSAEICNKAIVKYPTTPQTRHYTTLWNIDVRKLACPAHCGSLTER